MNESTLHERQAAEIRRLRERIQELHRKLGSAREHEEAALRVAYGRGAIDADVTAQIEHDRNLRRLTHLHDAIIGQAHGVIAHVASLAGRLRTARPDTKLPVSAVLVALDGILAGRRELRLPDLPDFATGRDGAGATGQLELLGEAS